MTSALNVSRFYIRGPCATKSRTALKRFRWKIFKKVSKDYFPDLQRFFLLKAVGDFPNFFLKTLEK
ncbi:MAG: hypothetical protein A2283_14220 [Lentisphaerae bacterium RIFOXYA12_FULL_48_11]|nr:MAG: hypothetical protein A2283_14220 [Lentisphaerae bacterium RIFOXYA12_FULL_48_11]